MHLCFHAGLTKLNHFIFANYYRKFPDRAEPLQVLYIDTKRSFPELDTFLHESVQRYFYQLFLSIFFYKKSVKFLHYIKIFKLETSFLFYFCSLEFPPIVCFQFECFYYLYVAIMFLFENFL